MPSKLATQIAAKLHRGAVNPGDSSYCFDRDDAAAIIDAGLADVLEALKAIAGLGGNLPDERLTDRTGPNDAKMRGLMYCSARSMATRAIASLRVNP